MTDREGWQPQQDYGQQHPQEAPWQAQQYDPAAHAQRIGAGQEQEPWQQYPQQQPYGYQQPQYPPPMPPWQQPPTRRKRHLGRKIAGGIAGLILVIIVISVAANSGGHTVNTTGTTPTTGTSATGTAPEGANPAAAARPKKAGIGSAITLAGNDSGEQVSATLVKVIGSASPDSSGLDDAPSGDRYYAAQFRIADTGSAAYSDSPVNGAQVVDSAGQSYDASLFDTVNDCVSFPAKENIAPGSSGTGCIVFEVPESAKIVSVQFTLDSGFGPQTGQWDVKG
jgi:hypothetical protein